MSVLSVSCPEVPGNRKTRPAPGSASARAILGRSRIRISSRSGELVGRGRLEQRRPIVRPINDLFRARCRKYRWL